MRRAGRTGEWVFGSPEELKQHKNFEPICSAANAVQSASLGITVSVHTAFTSHAASFMQSQGFFVRRIMEEENAWCLMLCYFNFMIAISSVEWALIAGYTR